MHAINGGRQHQHNGYVSKLQRSGKELILNYLCYILVFAIHIVLFLLSATYHAILCCSGADVEMGVESKLDASVDGAVSVMSMSHHGFRGTFKDKKRLAAMVYVSDICSPSINCTISWHQFAEVSTFMHFLTSMTTISMIAGNDGVQTEHKCGITEHYQYFHVAVFGEVLFSPANAEW